MKRASLPGGIELDYIDEGPHDAPVLMFLHGFPESHRTWRHQIAHFSDRFRCIAPDQRGYRGSSKPQDVASYSADKLIGDIFALADVLGVERFTPVGHDWGGVIAWGVALMGQGTRVDRAVIANAPHPAIFQKLLWLDPAQRAASQYVRAFCDPANDPLVRDHGLGGMIIKAFAGLDLGALDAAAQAGVLAMVADPAMAAEQHADWQDRNAAIAMLNWYRASALIVPPTDAAFALPVDWRAPMLPPLTIPTLVIWAMDDRALPACNLEGLAELVADLTIVRVPGCGHFVPWEAPSAVNAAMDAFLQPS
jgi:pimeloyl-ACP methyl ester carboxylesterase